MDKARYLRECEDICRELEREGRALEYRLRVDPEDVYLPHSLMAMATLANKLRYWSLKALDIIQSPRNREDWSNEHLGRVNQFCRLLGEMRDEHARVVTDASRRDGFVFELPPRYRKEEDLELDSRILHTVAMDTNLPIILSFPPQTDDIADRHVIPKLVTSAYHALGRDEFSRRFRTTGSRFMRDELERYM